MGENRSHFSRTGAAMDAMTKSASRRGGCWGNDSRFGVASNHDAHPSSITCGDDMGLRLAHVPSGSP